MNKKRKKYTEEFKEEATSLHANSLLNRAIFTIVAVAIILNSTLLKPESGLVSASFSVVEAHGALLISVFCRFSKNNVFP